MRLDRFLAGQGEGSRSEVRRLIRSGAVRLNGAVIRDDAAPVDPGRDLCLVSGREVRYREYIYLMLHKPAGVISATEDRRSPTVLDLLGAGYRKNELFPVGRLDKDTEGLLLLTNHGELGHRLLAPKKHVPKRYFAILDGNCGEAEQAIFQEGVGLEDGFLCRPAKLEIPDPQHSTEVQVVIVEGKFHQIKRMFAAVGKTVIYLKRLSMGSLELDEKLQPGQYRELTDGEIGELLQETGLK
jgi:16S rRNA pseudouridine516 synthase